MNKFLTCLLLACLATSGNLFAQESPEPEMTPEEFIEFERGDNLPPPRFNDDETPKPPSEDDIAERKQLEFEMSPAEPVENIETVAAEPETVPEGAKWEMLPHEKEAPSRSRKYPFRHLAEIPGQYRGDWFHLIRMKFVRNEIELVTDQRMAIYEVTKNYKKLSRTLLRERGEEVGLPHENVDAHKNLQQSLAQLQKDAVTEVKDSVLLPDQVQRLKEIDFRLKMKSRGIVETLKDKDLDLDIDDDQLEEIETRAKELVKEYDLLMKSFKYDFQQQILDKLDAGQRVRVDSLMGKELKVMKDEADEELTDEGREKTAALAKLEKLRKASGQ